MTKLIKKPTIAFIVLCLFVNIFNISVNAEEILNQDLSITSVDFTADSLNGVDALYRPGGSDGSNAVYSCAAYVKKYYKEVYGVTANNFYYNKTPKTAGDTFLTIEQPQIGDIAACNSGHGTTHWAIVKKVNDDDTVTLIEQNWKWQQAGQTMTTINRTVKVNSIKCFRLASVNEINIMEDLSMND